MHLLEEYFLMSRDNLQFQIYNRHYCRMSTVFMMHWGTCWQTQGIPLFLWHVRRLVFISWLSIVRCSTFIHNTYPHKWDTSILDCLYRGTLWCRLYAIDAGLNARSVAPKYTANSMPIFHSPGGYFTFFFFFLAFILKTRHPSGSGASYIFLTLSLERTVQQNSEHLDQNWYLGPFSRIFITICKSNLSLKYTENAINMAPKWIDWPYK